MLKKEHNHPHTQSFITVPATGTRLGASPHYTGRGVTIAFIDSGFYPHPDLVRPVNRIRASIDVTGDEPRIVEKHLPEPDDWHGTQTSVVAAGSGYLSDGLYRGIASDADVVLVKAGSGGRVSDGAVARALRWVIDHRNRYQIKVVSISLGGDREQFYKESEIDILAEEAVSKGLTVVAAAGNSGCTDHHQPVPPANSPSVITVGGYTDGNHPSAAEVQLYCSSFGQSPDGIVKPEVIAPAMWIAAPILPHTEAYQRAEALSLVAASLAETGKEDIPDELWDTAGLPGSLRQSKPFMIRMVIESVLKDRKIVATHYQHVDGTSFAAPIVASIIAQMLEANPRLSPSLIKYLLASTAVRISGAPAIRQGYGMINARRAVEMAEREHHPGFKHPHFQPRVISGKLVFTFHDHEATMVCVAGTFSNWRLTEMTPADDVDGIWRVKLKPPGPGRYLYKYLVNGERWMDDPGNFFKEPDSFGGFNSILEVR